MALKFLKKNKDKNETVSKEALNLEEEKPKHDLSKQYDNSKEKNGFVSRLRKGLTKTREILNTDVNELFARSKKIDDELFEQLEEILITSDIGVNTAMNLIQNLSKQRAKISDAQGLRVALKQEILNLLPTSSKKPESFHSKPFIILVVGVNGVGKTTTIGKLASKYSSLGKKVLISAADTFRAAAIEQLTIWAQRAGAEIVKHKHNADPSAVVFDSLEAAVSRGIDVVIVDTAGRVHTKVNLMEELKKIKRIISNKIPSAPHEVFIILDATTGQNAVSQATMFNEILGLTGIVLTKLDGTAKGGVVVSICNSLKIPLKFIGIGEQIEDLEEFDPKAFVDALF
ncbi:MAG: signal recognition particle-docking protein FtsY [Desulfobacterales bacterium]|nr:signal recognition particle-docking protein FtsY [Desulfobacterales bacterium]